MPQSTNRPTTIVVLGSPNEKALDALTSLESEAKIVKGKTASDCAAALPEARILFSWSGSRDDVRNAILQAPKLEWIHVRYAGLDKLLFPELIASPIPLTNGAGVFSQSLGEFIILGALYFAKDIPRMLRSKARREWDVFDVAEVSRQTMGIVGYGDIGRAIARRAKALEMRVYGLRRSPAPRPGDEFVDRVYPTAELHSMLPECDYVVVAAPLTPETNHMISTREFDRMKPDAIIMNVGRGPVIDEAAMVEALRSKRIRGAVLDVFEEEPLPQSSPLWEVENVLISAHTADHTKDWLGDAANFFIEQFGRWRRGETLKNLVDKQAGY
jgi:phosphoglycerate dehydrogenase-like enzyme